MSKDEATIKDTIGLKTLREIEQIQREMNPYLSYEEASKIAGVYMDCVIRLKKKEEKDPNE